MFVCVCVCLVAARYSRAAFLAHYKGAAEWDAAEPERRIDSDGGARSQRAREFAAPITQLERGRRCIALSSLISRRTAASRDGPGLRARPGRG